MCSIVEIQHIPSSQVLIAVLSFLPGIYLNQSKTNKHMKTTATWNIKLQDAELPTSRSKWEFPAFSLSQATAFSNMQNKLLFKRLLQNSDFYEYTKFPGINFITRFSLCFLNWHS